MALLDWLYPPSCVFCGKMETAKGSPFCTVCHAKWEMARRECVTAAGGQPVAYYRHDAARGEYYGSAVYLVNYDPGDEDSPVYKLLGGLKYHTTRRLTDFAAKELAAMLRQVMPANPACAVVTQIPRLPLSVQRYGCDHMKLVAVETAAMLGIPYQPLLERSGDALEQKRLSADKRMVNALNTTRLSKKYAGQLIGRTVILLDDLITTGASLHAAAELFIGAGAFQVIAATLAHTERRLK
ncbi:MAG: ComF family protein [Clostridia bacterium]|nr:ComF family protein [Clostridia bacterium]